MGSREPTGVERAGERALIVTMIVDVVLLVPFTVVAFRADSLTMLADVARALVMLALAFAAWRALRGINRGSYTLYDYGTGKIERMIGLGAALELVVCAAILGWVVGDSLLPIPELEIHSPSDLWMETTLALVNLVVNTGEYLLVHGASRGVASPIMRAQSTTQRVTAVAAVIVVIAALCDLRFNGTVGAVVGDAVGASLISAYMIWTAVKLVRDTLPDLLDRAIDPEHRRVIERHLKGHFESYRELIRFRSRGAGGVMLVDLELGFAPDRTIAEIQPLVDKLRDDIEAELSDARVTIIPRLSEASS